MSTALVGIIMGSDSDLTVMKAAADMLEEFDIPFELTVVSAEDVDVPVVSASSEVSRAKHHCAWLG